MCICVHIRKQRNKSYDIHTNDSAAAFINQRVVSPMDSDDGGRHGNIAMQPVDHKSISVCYRYVVRICMFLCLSVCICIHKHCACVYVCVCIY